MICRLRFVSGNRELKRASPCTFSWKIFSRSHKESHGRLDRENCSHCRPNCRAQWTLCIEDSLAYSLGNGRNCHRRSWTGSYKGEPLSLLKSQATKGESFAKFGLIRKKHKDTRRGF
jgi:hypothetical protein